MEFKWRKQLLVVFSFAIGLAIFLWLCEIIGWKQILKAFSVFTGWQGAVIVVLTLAISMIGNWRWKEILKNENIEVPFWKLFKIYLGGYSMMYLLPVIVWGGEAFRILGLSKEKKVPWQRAFSSVAIERVLEWTANIVIIILGILCFVLYKARIPIGYIFAVFGTALFIFVVAISFFYFKAMRRKSIVKGVVKRFWGRQIDDQHSLVKVENDIFNFFQLHNPYFGKGLLISFLRALAMQFRVWVLMIFLGAAAGFVPSLIVLSFSYLSSLVPIPAALGSHEALEMFAFSSMGLEVSMSTAFTMIIRAAEILISILGAYFIIRAGFSLIGNKEIKYDENQQNS